MTRFNKFILSGVFFLLFGTIFCNSIQAQTMTPGKKDPAGYEIMPLMLNQPGPILTAGAMESQLRQNLILDQGYEAHCAQKEWVIAKNIWGDIEEYFNQSSPSLHHYPQDGVPVFEGNDPYNVSFLYAHIPMMRGMEDSGSTAKNSSFEGMFGANLVSSITDDDRLNASGVALNLLSSYTQCYYKKNNIDAIGRICSQLNKSPNECYLNKTLEFKDFLGNSQTMKYLDIQGEFSKVRPELDGTDQNIQVCYDLFGGLNSSSPDLSNNPGVSESGPAVDAEELDYLRRAMDRVVIDLDNLYRLGFLVLVPTQDPDDTADKFHFLQSAGGINEKKDAPIVIAFKIPEFGTNKSYFAKNIDTLELTKMAIQEKERNDKDLEDQEAKRKQLLDRASAMPSTDEQSKAVKCEGMEQCLRTKENALSNTVIDIVNASQVDCTLQSLAYVAESGDPVKVFDQEDIHWEKAGDLYTPADKDLNESVNYLDPSNQWAFENLPGNKEPLFNWRLQIDENPPEIGESVRVRAYLVIPVGENIKDVNESLRIFWTQDAFEIMIENNVLVDMAVNQQGQKYSGAIPKFYTIKGEETEFSGSGEFDYLYSYEEMWVPLEGGGGSTQIVENRKKFGLNLTDSLQTELLFPDFGLGWMVRKIQTNLRSGFTETYDYVRSCERVEDLFLGRCSGNPEETSDPIVATTDDCPVILGYHSNIQLNKEGFLAEATEGKENTIMSEELYDYIVEKAIAAGYNPAVFLALGREETDWYNHPNANIKVMGCLGGGDLPLNSSPKEIIDHQMACVINNFPTSLSCQDFLCRYSGDAMYGPCEIKLNPTFAINLPIYYNAITTTSGVDEYRAFIGAN